MAIVLVIIGLIVGGILKGQEIVNNARVKTQVAQIDAIKAAVQTFYDKYGYYPGDDSQVVNQLGLSTSFAGNGDGFVSTAAGTADTDSAVEAPSKEPNAVWYELQTANLLSGVQSSNPSAAQDNTLSFNYQGKVGASYLTYADFSLSTGSTGTTIANKMVRISGTANSATGSPTPVLREQDASQIDTKYDDGLPYPGQIISASYSATTSCCGSQACNTPGSAYGLASGASTAGNYCALLWVTQ
jgi:hypothetical protein